MKKILFLLLPSLLLSEHIHSKEKTNGSQDVKKSSKIKCRWVCDKKSYREKEIVKAISFYKHSKYYKFK